MTTDNLPLVYTSPPTEASQKLISRNNKLRKAGGFVWPVSDLGVVPPILQNTGHPRLVTFQQLKKQLLQNLANGKTELQLWNASSLSSDFSAACVWAWLSVHRKTPWPRLRSFIPIHPQFIHTPSCSPQHPPLFYQSMKQSVERQTISKTCHGCEFPCFLEKQDQNVFYSAAE